MAAVSCALALLGGIIGAGFASGREIVHFFAAYGHAAAVAALAAAASLYLLFMRLCTRLERAGCASLSSLCAHALGPRLGALSSGLFLLLCAMTGGAMLAACAELGALTLYMPHAYACTMAVSLLLGLMLVRLGTRGVAIPGLALALLLPVLLVRLFLLPAGEARFLPMLPPDAPIRAACSGLCYGALSAAMLAGFLPALLNLSRPSRRRAAALFVLLFGLLLMMGVLVCRRHYAAVALQPLPFVILSRQLGCGYLLVAACMYAAALSTFCAMLDSLMRFFPRHSGPLASAALCLLFAQLGFSRLICAAYPALGALCAGLLLLLCLAPDHRSRSSR